jgi:hypothetical protein
MEFRRRRRTPKTAVIGLSTHNRYLADSAEQRRAVKRVFGEMQKCPELIQAYLLPVC